MAKKFLLTALATLLLALWPTTAWAEVEFTIADAAIDAPAGLAVDSERGVTWVTNETQAKVFALDSSGETLGEVTYTGSPQSVQALSLTSRGLFVGDIGGSRSTVTIYLLESLEYGGTAATAFNLTYPDGAHDAKAMAVSSRGNVYVITSGSDAGIYRVVDPIGTGATELTKIVAAPDDVVDCVFSQDGNELLLRTTESVIVRDAFDWRDVASAYTIPQENPDSIALAATGNQILLGSSEAGSSVYSQAVPTTFDTTRPEAPASSSPAPSESASPSASPSAEGDDATTPVSFQGTITALLIALGVSIVAGLVVAIKR